VLDRLQELSLVRDSMVGSGLGSVILTDCFLRVIDFTSVQDFWGPAMRILIDSGQSPLQWGIKPEMVPAVAETLKAVPRTIHAHYLATDAFLWSSLRPENLTISISDLTLKYGGTIPGKWKLLYILDAWTDSGDPPDIAKWSGGQMIDGLLTMMHSLRSTMGRPSSWIGITPRMIFRSARGWIPTPSNESS
jgi:hypothetical protein